MQKKIHCLLGLCSYFRKFIKEFSIKAKPLYNIIKKDAKFEFGEDKIQCFENLKNMLINAPILSIYEPKHETELHCDASSIGFGAILMKRKDDNKMHPIYFISKQTTDYERLL